MKHLLVGYLPVGKVRQFNMSSTTIFFCSSPSVPPANEKKEGGSAEKAKKKEWNLGENLKAQEACLEICSFTNLPPTLSFSVPGSSHPVCRQLEGFLKGDTAWLESH